MRKTLKEIHEINYQIVNDIISKANKLEELSLRYTACMLKLNDEDDFQKISNEADTTKNRMYGDRLFLYF